MNITSNSQLNLSYLKPANLTRELELDCSDKDIEAEQDIVLSYAYILMTILLRTETVKRKNLYPGLLKVFNFKIAFGDKLEDPSQSLYGHFAALKLMCRIGMKAIKIVNTILCLPPDSLELKDNPSEILATIETKVEIIPPVFPNHIATFYQFYKLKKEANSFYPAIQLKNSYKVSENSTREELKTIIEIYAFITAQALLKAKSKFLSGKRKNIKGSFDSQLIEIVDRDNCYLSKNVTTDSPQIQMAFKIVRRVIKIVSFNLNLPLFPPYIWATADPSVIEFHIPREIGKTMCIPFDIKNLLANYMNVHTSLQSLCSYIKPSGQKRYKYFIPTKTPLSEEEEQNAIAWYAYNIIKPIIRFTKDFPDQNFSGTLKPLVFSIENDTSRGIADAAISLATKILCLNPRFISCIKRTTSSSHIQLWIDKGTVTLPYIPLSVDKKNLETLGSRLYTAAKARQGTDFVIWTKEGTIAIHKVILIGKTKDAIERLVTMQQKTDELQLTCSLKVAEIFVEYLYTDNVTSSLPKTLEEICDLITFAHDLQLPYLKLLGEELLSLKATGENFVHIDFMAQNYQLERLHSFFSLKLALDPGLKKMVDLHFLTHFAKNKKALLTIENAAERYKLPSTLVAIAEFKFLHSSKQ